MNNILATGHIDALALKHQDRRFAIFSPRTVTDRRLAGEQSTVTRARNQVLQQLASEGVFQFRHYTYRTRLGTPEVRYRTLRTAVEQLNNEGRLAVVSHRPFGLIFDDGTRVSGVNVTAVPNQQLEEQSNESF